MKSVVAISILCFLAGLWFSDGAALGRVWLAMGQPALAQKMFRDPDWRAVAAYRAGSFDEAAHGFTLAKDYYNRGNAYAMSGRYAEALESYDIAIAQGHVKARANFDLVAAHYAGLAIDPDALALFKKRETGPKEESFVAQGDGRAAGTGSEATNTNSLIGLAELESLGRLGVR
ncbi:MAG: tetratricopeptide repeat protein, partial [Pseudomonadota bacterium]